MANGFVERAFEAGRAACANGIKCAPCLDRAAIALMREANPSGTIGNPLTTKILTAWADGWTAENLSAAVA